MNKSIPFCYYHYLLTPEPKNRVLMPLNPDLTHPILLPDGNPWPHTVLLKQVIDHPNIEVGDFSYYNNFGTPKDYAKTLAPYLHPGAPEKLILGKFVQVAHGVQFITSSANHQMNGFSTFPFPVFEAELAQASYKNKGNTVIGHDVWLGHEAIIMPGVTIGSGSIIGARAVVAKDVEPYSIIAGNPGTVVRKRFDDKQIKALLDLAWWDWELDKIKEHAQDLIDGDFSLFTTRKT